jgi:type II secretory pathway component PulM
MRRDADILVLDEPTAAMDAESEAQVFGHVRDLAEGRIQVAVKPVAFDALVRLLGELGAGHGLAVESLVVRAAPEPGRVQVESLVLRTGAAG